jgi:hypothetical protein
MPAQGTEVHGSAGSALGVLEVETGAERPGAPREHHDRSFAVILEAPRRIRELAYRFRRQSIDAVAAVEADHRYTAIGAEPLFDSHKILRHAPSPEFSEAGERKCPDRRLAGSPPSGTGKPIVVPIMPRPSKVAVV